LRGFTSSTIAPVLGKAVKAKANGKGSKKASGKGSKPVYAEITQDYLNAAHGFCSAWRRRHCLALLVMRVCSG